MHKTLLFLLIFAMQLGFAQKEQDIWSDNTGKTSLDSLVNIAIKPFFKENRKGLSIALYAKNVDFYYNYVNDSKSSLSNRKTIYEIGSVTKTFAGYLLAEAVVNKKVKLDDDIRNYLDEKYPNLEYNGSPIRLFHLLNHSSGLPFDFINKDSYMNLSEDERILKLVSIENSYQQKDILRDLHLVQLDTVPGIKLRYSNVAAQILGIILEHIYKKPYEELVSEMITEPIKMQNTFFSLPANKKGKLVRGHTVTGMVTPHFNGGLGSGLYSTTEDLLKYGKLHLNDSSEIVKLVHMPTWGQIQYYAMGLNWQMEQKQDKPKRFWQSGSTPGYTSHLAVYPDLNVVIVLLANEHDENSEGDLSKIAEKIIAGIPKTKIFNFSFE